MTVLWELNCCGHGIIVRMAFVVAGITLLLAPDGFNLCATTVRLRVSEKIPELSGPFSKKSADQKVCVRGLALSSRFGFVPSTGV